MAPSPAFASTPSPNASSYEGDGVDFEIVFGRRQVASTGLVLLVILACFSGLSYLIGKGVATKAPLADAEPLGAPAVTPAPTAPAAKPAAEPLLLAASASARGLDASKPQPPVYAEAISGKVYIQVGAIDKGLAGVWAEGLRTHGLPAFVATGPSDKTWRVLVGPLADPPAFKAAKEMLDQLGISTFGKRYESQSVAP